MKKILLFGYYGKGNAGDDALAYVCIDQLWKMLGDTCCIEIISNIPVVHESGASLIYPDFTQKFARLRSIISSDVLVFGGGGIFQDHRKSGHADLWEKYCYVALARLLRKKVVFLGISVGPLVSKMGRKLTKKILEKAHLITLRDEQSYRLVNSEFGIKKNVVKSFDLAVLMGGGANGSGVIRETKTLGVSLMPLSLSNLIGDKQELYSSLAENIKCLIDCQGLQVKLIEFNRNDGDGEVMADLACLIDRPGFVTSVPYSDHPGEMARIVGQCSHFLAMRLHSAVFSFMCGIPFALINYHDKCEGFAQEINLAPERLICSADLSEIASKVEQLLSSNDKGYEYSLEDAEKAAYGSFAQLWKLLDDLDSAR